MDKRLIEINEFFPEVRITKFLEKTCSPDIANGDFYLSDLRFADYCAELFGKKYSWSVLAKFTLPEMIKNIIVQIACDPDASEAINSFHGENFDKTVFYRYLIGINHFISEKGCLPIFGKDGSFFSHRS